MMESLKRFISENRALVAGIYVCFIILTFLGLMMPAVRWLAFLLILLLLYIHVNFFTLKVAGNIKSPYKYGIIGAFWGFGLIVLFVLLLMGKAIVLNLFFGNLFMIISYPAVWVAGRCGFDGERRIGFLLMWLVLYYTLIGYFVGCLIELIVRKNKEKYNKEPIPGTSGKIENL